jgi:predicted dehydrogenase
MSSERSGGGIPRRKLLATAAPIAAIAAALPRTARAAEQAGGQQPVRLGIIGLDTSHAPAFAKLFNAADDPQHVPGCRVVAAHPHGSRTIESSMKRISEYTEAVKKHGVEIVDGVGPLVERVDAVLLETNDGGPHLEQAAVVLRAGKPLFIDKPVAASLADTIAIYRLAAERSVPIFSSSSLRFAAGTQAVRNGSIGDVTGCDTWSPCATEPSHPDFFWYGIHGCESLFTVMGAACETVSRTSTPDFEHAVGVWSGGRIGTFRGIRRGASGYGGTAFGTKGTAAVGMFDGYRPLGVVIAEFMRTRQPPVPPAETLALYAFMEAADESKRRGGGPVRLAEMMARAEAAATERLAKLPA